MRLIDTEDTSGLAGAKGGFNKLNENAAQVEGLILEPAADSCGPLSISNRQRSDDNLGGPADPRARRNEGRKGLALAGRFVCQERGEIDL